MAMFLRLELSEYQNVCEFTAYPDRYKTAILHV
jgi:hypothetical protein